jgi:N-formylglutamate amidohydrolase
MKVGTLLTPTQDKHPIVANIPHCGTHIPDSIRRKFKRDPEPILPSHDWFLDKLYDFLPALGVTVLHANYSRYVVDLERDIAAPHLGPFMSSIVYEDTMWGRPLYEIAPTQSEVEERIKEYYIPYHEQLADLLGIVIGEFGRVYLLDLHSFFGHPYVDASEISTEVELGNRHGTTCSEHLIECFAKAFRAHSFRVASNSLWRGGHIPQHYGSMGNVESLSIEIRLPVYLDKEYFGEEEVTEWDSDRFRSAKSRLREVFANAIGELPRH